MKGPPQEKKQLKSGALRAALFCFDLARRGRGDGEKEILGKGGCGSRKKAGGALGKRLKRGAACCLLGRWGGSLADAAAFGQSGVRQSPFRGMPGAWGERTEGGKSRPQRQEGAPSAFLCAQKGPKRRLQRRPRAAPPYPGLWPGRTPGIGADNSAWQKAAAGPKLTGRQQGALTHRRFPPIRKQPLQKERGFL